VNKPSAAERRRYQRKNVSYYLPVMDNNSQKVIGHLVDISLIGLMMDSKIPIQTNLSFSLRLDFTEDMAGKACLEFKAVCRWCRPDKIQPYMYNVGFQIINISPRDTQVIQTLSDRYGER
jgi:hypothetical protein